MTHHDHPTISTVNNATTTTSPTSPFLQNLTRRLRAGSSASRTSSQSSDHEQDPKSTRKYLASILRDDWQYPDHLTDARHDATSYRLRDESVSEHDEKEYKFDSPDDVGASLARRKARKRRLLEQEMSWNEGLRVWQAQREAWTGSTSKPKRLSQSSKTSSGSESSGRVGHGRKKSSHIHKQDQDKGQLPTNEVIQREDSNDGENTPENEQLNVEGPYLPIYPPLLPASHTLRLRITTNSYPTIYSKVVIQGLAPNVPIPLNHMIGALVNGWKLEGNWPPSTTMEPKVQKKGRQKSAFKRWKAEQEEKKTLAMKQAQIIEDKGKRRSFGGVVKKALGLGGPEEEDLEKMGLTFETDDEDELKDSKI